MSVFYCTKYVHAMILLMPLLKYPAAAPPSTPALPAYLLFTHWDSQLLFPLVQKSLMFYPANPPPAHVLFFLFSRPDPLLSFCMDLCLVTLLPGLIFPNLCASFSSTVWGPWSQGLCAIQFTTPHPRYRLGTEQALRCFSHKWSVHTYWLFLCYRNGKLLIVQSAEGQMVGERGGGERGGGGRWDEQWQC